LAVGPKCEQWYDCGVFGVCVGRQASGIVFPGIGGVGVVNIEQADGFHDVVHLVPVELEKAYQKISHEGLVLALFQL